MPEQTFRGGSADPLTAAAAHGQNDLSVLLIGKRAQADTIDDLEHRAEHHASEGGFRRQSKN
jgi:hypothetical protein